MNMTRTRIQLAVCASQQVSSVALADKVRNRSEMLPAFDACMRSTGGEIPAAAALTCLSLSVPV